MEMLTLETCMLGQMNAINTIFGESMLQKNGAKGLTYLNCVFGTEIAQSYDFTEKQVVRSHRKRRIKQLAGS